MADVRMQEGSDGCSVAQERAVCAGWAGEVIGESCDKVNGRVCARLGNRIGEMNGLAERISVVFTSGLERMYGHLSLDIS